MGRKLNYSMFGLTLSGVMAICIALVASQVAFAEEPIVGKWKTESGEQAQISSCGGSYCIKLITGKYAGKTIGRLKGNGAAYSGTVNDPTDDKQYSGSAKIKGSGMKLRGCFLKVFCKTQNWRKL